MKNKTENKITENVLDETKIPIKLKILNFVRDNIVLVALVFSIIFFASFSEYFFSLPNFFNIGRQVAVIGTIGAAATMVIITGNIDLSVGSTVGLSSVVLAIVLRDYRSLPLAILAAISIGLVFGFINGILSTKGKIPAFLVTLGTMGIMFGIAMVITNTRAISIMNPTFWFIFGDDLIFNFLPASIVWMLVIIGISHFILKYTAFGRTIYATGDNRIGALFTGINIDRVVITAFMLSGLYSALGGLLLAARMHTARGTFGQAGLMLSVIAAVILGGTSLYGGKGSIIGSFLGALVIGVLNNGLIIMGLDTYAQDIVRGAVIIIAVLLGRKR